MKTALKSNTSLKKTPIMLPLCLCKMYYNLEVEQITPEIKQKNRSSASRNRETRVLY